MKRDGFGVSSASPMQGDSVCVRYAAELIIATLGNVLRGYDAVLQLRYEERIGRREGMNSSAILFEPEAEGSLECCLVASQTFDIGVHATKGARGKILDGIWSYSVRRRCLPVRGQNPCRNRS